MKVKREGEEEERARVRVRVNVRDGIRVHLGGVVQ